MVRDVMLFAAVDWPATLLTANDTVWSLEAGQATIFIVDVHYYSEDDDAEMYD